MNLRDSAAEDNVRKRPFPNKFLTRHPFGLSKSAANLRKIPIHQKLLKEKYRFNIAFYYRPLNIDCLPRTVI